MSILQQIGNTPLVQYKGRVPNGNRILIKCECDNPFGSHYDRVYHVLYPHLARAGRLRPGCTVLETTSGSAGVSFAGIGKKFGYKCVVAIPEQGERAREHAIQAQGAELILTPAEAYVSGFPSFLRQYLKDHPDVVFLNHSMGARGAENEVTTSSLAMIAREIIDEIGVPDYFIAAIGNGSSLLGPGREFAKRGTKVIAFESFQSAVGFERMYPGRYKQEYGIEPGSLPRHRLPGTSFQGIEFPHIRLAYEEGLISETRLVTDGWINSWYFQRTGREATQYLPSWTRHADLPYGRTTRAGLAVALRVAEQVIDQVLVIIAYDKPDRYDT